MAPRQAPVWWQAANVMQYVDWQAAMSWGAGIMTSPVRVIATILWMLLGWSGFRAMRRDSRMLADALLVLLACGTLGVAIYLNLKLGASLGWGFVSPDTAHEARERDYFFVLGFVAWGCLAGYGAVALARARRCPIGAGVAVALLPLAGNWSSADRTREPTASAARHFAMALLVSAPPGAVVFLDGDNDSYPIWYLQQVEGVRRDVVPVTIPLLPAAWYPAELQRRTGLLREPGGEVPGALTFSEQQAGLLARAAHRAGRPVLASPALPARERALLGADWVMRGPVYIAESGLAGEPSRARVDSAAAGWWREHEPVRVREGAPPADDVAWLMLSLLQCPRLMVSPDQTSTGRDSLEVKCNLR
jgi:hypothetical protein